jgi:uncharacterized protein
MNKILSLDELENSKNKTLYFTFDEKIKGIDCVEPIHAELCAKSLGDFIQISGNVTGKVLLECDLCLEKYEYNLDFSLDELFSKGSLLGDYEESGQEFEIKDGQFVTDLNGDDEIDIYDLLYQSVILNFPNKKVCGINCKGREYISQEEDIPDPRLEVFNNLQINPKK